MPRSKKVPSLKIMVASTIYGFEDQLDQICAMLRGYGYEVWNSHLKTIPIDPSKSNTGNCLAAVEACDLMFGIQRPVYGSGVIGEVSITHQEMVKAIELKKPRWFIAHRDIAVARQLLKQYMYMKNPAGDDPRFVPNPDFKYAETSVLDDIRLIHLYNATIKNEVKPAERIGHWVDEYFRLPDILQCIETQFSDVNRIRDLVNEMKKLKDGK